MRYTPSQKFGDKTIHLCGPCLERHITLGTDLERLWDGLEQNKRGKRMGRFLYGLENVLEKKGLTHAAAARRCGVEERGFGRLVNLKQRASAEREKKIAGGLNVPLKDLRA
jgi:hypothetical protein